MFERRGGLVFVTAVMVGAVGCNEPDGPGAFDSAGGTTTGTASSASASASTTVATETAEGTTAPESTTGSSGEIEEGTTDETKLDVGAPPGGLGPCGCELAYIWIANADEGTVSKVNVRTMIEEGRYITRPDGVGNPSRTSVNLSGDVAVANRHGGLTKFYADPDKCQESNGMPGIQTSTGKNDVLSWDMEECRAWYTEFPVTNQRPVAWTPGEITPGECDSTNERVWTVASATPGIAPGTGGAGGVNAYLVDGEDGTVAEEILIEDFSGFQLGAYGGAVNSAGDLFICPMGAVSFGGQLGRVELDTLEITLWPMPQGVASYGITVDHNGMVWVSSTLGAGAARFDPETEVWDVVNGFSSLGGLMEGPGDLMWVSATQGAISIDINTLAFGPVFVTNMGGEVKGISIDVDGYTWVVNNIAFKVDPMTGIAVDFYNGLTGPYTYSDMTGYALGNVTCPPEG